MSSHSTEKLFRRRRIAAFLTISVVAALIATFFGLYAVSLPSFGVKQRELAGGAATTRAQMQLPPRWRPSTATAFEAQTKRANLIANLMATPVVLDRVSHQLGIEPEALAASADLTISLPVAFLEPNAERRATEIREQGDPYRLDLQADPTAPIIDIYAQGPSAAAASELARATVIATNQYLRSVGRDEFTNGRQPVVLARLGPIRSGEIESSAKLKIAALTFITTFAISLACLFLIVAIIRGWRKAAGRNHGLEGRAPRPPSIARSRRSDDWPHTTRILPWMIAGFLCLIWLVPVNAITLQVSLPFELKLDRLVLPVIVFVWLLSLAAGGRSAPRWRFTRVHGAVALFALVAFLSVVLNATGLARTLELELAIKKLTLLLTFLSIFFVVASSVRPSEIRPFLTLFVALACICAFGVVWEYQFGTDYFYRLSSDFLPGFFHVAAIDTTGFDEIGRPAVIGPADLSLELVAMLAMALPVALVRLMDTRRTRGRILYGLAVCLILAGMIATYRKSALVAPVAICLILVYFRRREMMRLLPLALVLVIAIPVMAPNALGSIVDQLKPSRLGVSTVSDRVSDYDAIRPDVLSKPLFGSGYGSYEHTNHRILDNDLLMRVVETGLVGLVAFVMMIVLVFAIAAPIVRRGEPEQAAVALACAAAAGAFLVLSVLFDVMSFPHTPYLIMVLLGFLAVIVAYRDRTPARPVGRSARSKVTLAPAAQGDESPADDRPARIPVGV
jgi:O-antigen ligase